MQKILVALHRVELATFDPRTTTAKLRVTYTKNNQPDTFDIPCTLHERNDTLTQNIIKEIKTRSKTKNDNSDEDDFLQTFPTINFTNEERTEELLPLYLHKLHEKTKHFKHEKNHTTYMKLLDEIQTLKLTL